MKFCNFLMKWDSANKSTLNLKSVLVRKKKGQTKWRNILCVCLYFASIENKSCKADARSQSCFNAHGLGIVLQYISLISLSVCQFWMKLNWPEAANVDVAEYRFELNLSLWWWYKCAKLGATKSSDPLLSISQFVRLGKLYADLDFSQELTSLRQIPLSALASLIYWTIMLSHNLLSIPFLTLSTISPRPFPPCHRRLLLFWWIIPRFNESGNKL